MSKRETWIWNIGILALLLIGLGYVTVERIHAQSTPAGGQSPTAVNPLTPVAITALTATAGSGATATVTIPAPPPGQYNYVCYLALEGSNDNTATAVTNAVTTNTNFGTFAGKFSTPSSASNDTGVFIYLNAVPPGCPKSVSPTTATTFVSPSSTHEQYAWYATYFQAP